MGTRELSVWSLLFGKPTMGRQNKDRKAHLTSNATERRKIMSCPLSKDLQKQFGISRMPLCRGDSVIVTRGDHQDMEGKVTSVYRKRFHVIVDQVHRTNCRGEEIAVPMQCANLKITDLAMSASRKKVIERKAAGRASAMDILAKRPALKVALQAEN